MVVVPAGKSVVGSPSDRGDKKEHPQHTVTIAKPFAVSRFEVTAEQWQACLSYGGCPPGGGTGKEPASSIRWHDAKHYVSWLSNLTGQSYRLLSNAEWEYAARAGSTTDHSWGNELGKGHANCSACGSQWDGKSAAPVGSSKPNDFGLYDMHGNVWEWVENPWHDDYTGAPTDGSAWLEGANPRSRVIHAVHGTVILLAYGWPAVAGIRLMTGAMMLAFASRERLAPVSNWNSEASQLKGAMGE
jgi:formylglycine-generating enzyme required for sulfatase activity